MARRSGSRIHEGLVGQRALIGSAYLRDPGLRREYDAEIAPRTRAALARIFAADGVPPVVRRALDLGAGTGASADAIRTRFGAAVEVVSVDQVAGPGIIVADLRRPGRPAGVTGRFDLIVVAHLLNELGPLGPVASAELVAGWCRELLVEGGVCVVLEPALRETSRALLAVRDQLVTQGLRVVAPCFWTGPCPALARERDWCHDAVPATRTRALRVDFSYLVLRLAVSAVPDAPAPAGADGRLFRVVSEPLKDKGRLRIFGCGGPGRLALVRLTRDRAPGNRDFDEAGRGDVLTLGGAQPASDGLRVTAQTTVVRKGQ